MIHLTLRYGLLIGFLLGQAVAWRFGNQWIGLGASCGLLLLSSYLASFRPDCWRYQQILCYLAAALIAGLGSFPALWPCELGCSKGADYALIFDLSVARIAAGCYFFSAIAFCCGNNLRPSLLLHSLTWLFAGSSLFYLGLSMYLGIICPFCLSIHSCVLAASICAWPTRRSIILILLSLLLGAGIVSATYATQYYLSQHGRTQIFTPQANPLDAFLNPTPTHPATADQTIIDAINKGRSLGEWNAPYRLACFIRLGCEHCATWVPDIYQSSKSLCKELPLSIRFHYMVTRVSDKSVQRHYLALCAALKNKFFIAQSALLGNEADQFGYAESLRSMGLNPEALQELANQHSATLATLVDQDFALLNTSTKSASTTPIFLLLKDGIIVNQWDGSTTWGQIIIDIQEQVQTDGKK